MSWNLNKYLVCAICLETDIIYRGTWWHDSKDTRSVNQRYPKQSAGLRKPLQRIKKYAKKLTILLASSNFQVSRLDPYVFFKNVIPVERSLNIWWFNHFASKVNYFACCWYPYMLYKSKNTKQIYFIVFISDKKWIWVWKEWEGICKEENAPYLEIKYADFIISLFSFKLVDNNDPVSVFYLRQAGIESESLFKMMIWFFFVFYSFFEYQR